MLPGLRPLLASLALAVASAASAGPALIAPQGGTLATAATDQLYGWRFSLAEPIKVSALGAFDLDLDGMSVAHDVGIFDASTEALLASATLAAGLSGFLVGDFRYQSLVEEVLLGPGSYVIAMTMPAGSVDPQLILGSLPVMAPEVTYLGSAFDGGSTLGVPRAAFNGSYAEGLFGPNFLFEVAGATVPEPASLALAGLALLAAAAARRRA